MQKIDEILEAYLSSWEECYYCNDMVKVHLLQPDYEGNPICHDCTG